MGKAPCEVQPCTDDFGKIKADSAVRLRSVEMHSVRGNDDVSSPICEERIPTLRGNPTKT